MKRLLLIPVLLLCTLVLRAQPIFDLGLKAGINNSKVSFDLNDYNENTITKMHFGAFGRVGVGKIYLQPEVYYTKKGGELKSVTSVVSDFDYSAVDVPLLLGFRILDAKAVKLNVMGGPVFGFVTKGSINDVPDLNEDYIRNHYTGFQYGIGVDVLFMTVDFRMEQGNKVYDAPTVDGKGQTFMVTVGFKLL